MFFLLFWLSTATFEMALIGLVPVDSAVSEDLAGAVIEPGSEFFVLEVGILLVDRWARSILSELVSKSLVVAMFLAFSIPYHPRATNPLTQNEFLV